jgi:hypothetical protein
MVTGGTIVAWPTVRTGAEKGAIAIHPAGHRASSWRTVAYAIHCANNFDFYDAIWPCDRMAG